MHYQDESAVIEIPSGKLLEGNLKGNKLKLVEAWIEIHKKVAFGAIEWQNEQDFSKDTLYMLGDNPG